jgi:hypothetical protein
LPVSPGLKMLILTGDIHAHNGRVCRRLGYIISGKSNLGLAICWFHHHIREVYQG